MVVFLCQTTAKVQQELNCYFGVWNAFKFRLDDRSVLAASPPEQRVKSLLVALTPFSHVRSFCTVSIN